MDILYWFRDDLRLHDNPAWTSAIQSSLTHNGTITCIYVLQPNAGGAAHWWNKRSVEQLKERIEAKGGAFYVFSGEPEYWLDRILDQGFDELFFTRCYQPYEQATEEKVEQLCSRLNITTRSFASDRLIEPAKFVNLQGQPYKVFTPFYKRLKQLYRPHTLPSFNESTLLNGRVLKELEHEQTDLAREEQWEKKFYPYWSPGELGAREQFNQFIQHHVKNYATDRDFPSITNGTSFLSAALRCGEISVHYMWQTLSHAFPPEDVEPFLRQLVWRDFSQYLLHHFPYMADQAFNARFDDFEWSEDSQALRRWQRGETGYPIVDAGMRQLWETGWMHNRVRMVVASFLCKHLLQHWQHGLAWFNDTLVDADYANNIASWQWVAGCGADAAPYFRIFNPELQSTKFDKGGEYLRSWVPELASYDNKHIHAPWKAPKVDLFQQDLGVKYPTPIIEHSYARDRALTRYQALRDLPQAL